MIATIIPVDEKTSIVSYSYFTSIPPTVRGPMPNRQARSLALFLEGRETPHDPSGRGPGSALRPIGSRLSDR